MKILYITSLVDPNKFTLTKQDEFKYYYGLKKILGENNVKLTNIIDVNIIDQFDYILIGKDFLNKFYTRKIIENIIKKYKEKIFAIIDTFDDIIIDKMIYSENIKCYFKREIPNVYNDKEILKRYILSYFSVKNSINLFQIKKLLDSNKLIPLPLTYHILEQDTNLLNSVDKRYSVSFIANLHPATGNLFGKFFRYEIWEERIKTAEICKKVPNSYVKLNYANVYGGLHLIRYYDIIKSSYASVSVISSSFDTNRRWEIPYMRTVLISKKLPIIIPNDFIHGVHAFFYENIKELKILLQEILKNKDELVEMGKKAREYVIKFHSPEARARAIINALTQ
jgi:hypothetical protein